MNSILYARFSPRPNAETCESIEFQTERCTAMCAAKGWPVLATFEDRELSGRNAHNRPGLQAALKAACENKAVLCIYSLSRLARNTGDAIEIVNKLDKCGANLVSVSETLDTTSASGRFMFTIFAALATLERETIADRTSDAMIRHQSVGRRMGRKDLLPWGWMLDPDNDKMMLRNEVECQEIVHAVMLWRQKMTYPEIAATMNARGLLRGKPWDKARVAGVLHWAKERSM